MHQSQDAETHYFSLFNANNAKSPETRILLHTHGQAPYVPASTSSSGMTLRIYSSGLSGCSGDLSGFDLHIDWRNLLSWVIFACYSENVPATSECFNIVCCGKEVLVFAGATADVDWGLISCALQHPEQEPNVTTHDVLGAINALLDYAAPKFKEQSEVWSAALPNDKK